MLQNSSDGESKSNQFDSTLQNKICFQNSTQQQSFSLQFCKIQIFLALKPAPNPIGIPAIKC